MSPRGNVGNNAGGTFMTNVCCKYGQHYEQNTSHCFPLGFNCQIIHLLKVMFTLFCARELHLTALMSQLGYTSEKSWIRNRI